MKTIFKKQYPVLVGSFLSAGCLGWIMSKQIPSKHESVHAENISHSSSNKRELAKTNEYRVPDAAKEKIRAIRSIKNPADQLRATISLVNSLPLDELKKWIEGRWFNDTEGYNLTAFNYAAKERWSHEDPRSAYEWAMKNNSYPYDIAKAWAEKDPEGIMAYIKEHPGEYATNSAISVLAKSHPDFAISILEKIAQGNGNRNFNNDNLVREIMSNLANADDPRVQALIAQMPSDLQWIAKGVAQEKLLTASFEKSFADFINNPDALKLFSSINWSSGDLREKLLSHLNQLTPQLKERMMDNYYELFNEANEEQRMKVLQTDFLAAGFTPERLKNLYEHGLSYLSGEKALLAMNGMQLSEEQYSEYLKKIFSRYNKNLSELKKFETMLTDAEDKAVLATFISAAENQQNLKEKKISAKEATTNFLQEALTQISNKDNNGYHQVALINELGGMNKEQLSILLTQFDALPESDQIKLARQVGISSSLYGNDRLSDEIRNKMVNTLLKSKGNEDGAIRLTSDHAVKLLNNDPTQAVAYVQKLPDGNARINAQKNLAYNWMLYDYDAANRYLQSLPANSQAEVKKYLIQNHFNLNP